MYPFQGFCELCNCNHNMDQRRTAKKEDILQGEQQETRSVPIKIEPVCVKDEPEPVIVYSERVHEENQLENMTWFLLDEFSLTKGTDCEEKRMALLLHLHNTTRIRENTCLEVGGGFLNMPFDHLFAVVGMQLLIHESDVELDEMKQDADTDIEDEMESEDNNEEN